MRHGRRLDQLLGAVVVARVVAVGGRAERVDGVGGGPMGGGMGGVTSGRAPGVGASCTVSPRPSVLRVAGECKL